MNALSLIIPVVGSIASAAAIDFNAFVKAREKDRSTTFDWMLFAGRIATGAATGVVTWAGMSAVGVVK